MSAPEALAGGRRANNAIAIRTPVDQQRAVTKTVQNPLPNTLLKVPKTASQGGAEKLVRFLLPLSDNASSSRSVQLRFRFCKPHSVEITAIFSLSHIPRPKLGEVRLDGLLIVVIDEPRGRTLRRVHLNLTKT
jgi:hypothetical protein